MQEVGGAGRGGEREREKAEFVNVSVGENPAEPGLSLYLRP